MFFNGPTFLSSFEVPWSPPWVTLIKSTLSNLPTHILYLFFPFLLHWQIAYQCDFLWGGLGEEFKYHLVSWSKVCSPISEGGLGICNLILSNQALLWKWLWCYLNESEAWWKTIMDAKYGCNWGGWCSVDPPGSTG
jgi:hypothetical protein